MAENTKLYQAISGLHQADVKLWDKVTTVSGELYATSGFLSGSIGELPNGVSSVVAEDNKIDDALLPEVTFNIPAIISSPVWNIALVNALVKEKPKILGYMPSRIVLIKLTNPKAYLDEKIITFIDVLFNFNTKIFVCQLFFLK